MRQIFCVILLIAAAFAVSAPTGTQPTDPTSSLLTNATASDSESTNASDLVQATAPYPDTNWINATATTAPDTNWINETAPESPNAVSPYNAAAFEPDTRKLSTSDEARADRQKRKMRFGGRPGKPFAKKFGKTPRGKGRGAIFDNEVKIAQNATCDSIKTWCPECGKGACVEHIGRAATPCCTADYDLKCCVDVPAPAPVPMVEITEECKQEHKDCSCGWGSCVRQEGTSATTCCETNYQFMCCKRDPTTTTVIPEQRLNKACEDAASLCSCGWANCVEVTNRVDTFCCGTGYALKCCDDPTRPQYQLIRTNPKEVMEELHAKEECKGKSVTCTCGYQWYEAYHAFKFPCCDSNIKCKCCDTDHVFHRAKPDFFTEPAGKPECKKFKEVAVHTQKPKPPTGVCIWHEEADGKSCCPKGYRFDPNLAVPQADGSHTHIEASSTAECPFILEDPTLLKESLSPEFVGCVKEWLWYLDAVPIPNPKAGEVDEQLPPIDDECSPAQKSCDCGWGACVRYTGWAASGCCPENYTMRCCTTESPTYVGAGVGLTTITKPMTTTADPSMTSDEPDSALGVVPSATSIVIVLWTLLCVYH